MTDDPAEVTVPVVPLSSARCEHLSIGGPLIHAGCGVCGPLPLTPSGGTP